MKLRLSFSPVFLISGAIFLFGLAPDSALAQKNDKKALRDASGVYKGGEGPIGGEIFATGRGRVNIKETGKKVNSRVIEDAPSTITTSGTGRVKRTKVTRGGKKIVSTVRSGRATELMGGEFFAAYTGTSKGETKARGRKFKGDGNMILDNEGDVFFTGTK